MFHYVLSPRVDDVPMQPPMQKPGRHWIHPDPFVDTVAVDVVVDKLTLRRTHNSSGDLSFQRQHKWGSNICHLRYLGVIQCYSHQSIWVILGFTPGFFDPSPFVSRDNSFKISTRSNKIRRHQRQHQHMVHINQHQHVYNVWKCVYIIKNIRIISIHINPQIAWFFHGYSSFSMVFPWFLHDDLPQFTQGKNPPIHGPSGPGAPASYMEPSDQAKRPFPFLRPAWHWMLKNDLNQP